MSFRKGDKSSGSHREQAEAMVWGTARKKRCWQSGSSGCCHMVTGLWHQLWCKCFPGFFFFSCFDLHESYSEMGLKCLKLSHILIPNFKLKTPNFLRHFFSFFFSPHLLLIFQIWWKNFKQNWIFNTYSLKSKPLYLSLTCIYGYLDRFHLVLFWLLLFQLKY